MAFKPSARRKAQAEMRELDLTPYMNFIMILIPVIMQASEYIKLAMLKIDLPPQSGGSGAIREDQEQQEEQQTLDLAVAITTQGFTITSAQAKLPIIPMKGDEYDFEALNEKLWELKRTVAPMNYPDGENIIIAASFDIKYEVIVKTMDAARAYVEELEGGGEHANVRTHVMFPVASLSPGIT